MKQAAIIIALVMVLTLPFVLRPKQQSLQPADDTVVIVSPHNEAIRYEFSRGFAAWYRARTGRTVRIDWRVIGGTSDIARFLEGAYVTAFENEWEKRRHRAWTQEVQTSFQRAGLAADSPADVRDARVAFLSSDVGCGIDVFFGGDAYQFGKEAEAGRLVDCGMRLLHPEWFDESAIPEVFGGEPFRDKEDRWFGVVLSSYGIIFNRDNLRRLTVRHDPTQWADLADPRLQGEVGLADPTKSGSVCEAFENIIQQQMQRELMVALRKGAATDHDQAIRDGWINGLRLIQRMGANARYFTDSSQKPPIDVAMGDCAAGLCIDFYGRQQQEAVKRRGDSDRIGYVSPVGGSASSTDPIGLLRGAPHRDVAVAFIEYTLSLEGQKLWAFRPETPGGPERFALRRMPVRRDFYAHREWQAQRSDPGDAPYEAAEPFVYHPEWTGALFREIGFVTRVMCQDTHAELAAAWQAINTAAEPAKSKALAVMQDVSAIDYERTRGEIHRRLNARNRVEEVQLASELARWFRDSYARAKRIAEGGK